MDNEDREKIERINNYCIEQMQAASKEQHKLAPNGDLHTGEDQEAYEYYSGIWLVCSKIHGFIIRTIKDADEMGKLKIVEEARSK